MDGRKKTQFQPGNKGGPGRPKMGEFEKLARRKVPESLAQWFLELYVKTPAELKAIIGHVNRDGIPSGTENEILKITIARMLLGGQTRDMEFLLNRILGKPKETIDLGSEDGAVKINVEFARV